MPRPIAFLAALTLAGALLVPAGTARAEPVAEPPQATLQRPDVSPNIDPSTPVIPDLAYESQGGDARVELYTSIGDNQGGVDWRPVNAFAYLLNSVPKYKKIRATIYNTLWDGDKAVYSKSKDQWTIYDSTGKVKRTAADNYGPTQALLKQLNQYTKEERSQYIQLLLSKKSMRDAKAAGSGLASLIYGTASYGKVYKECRTGNGACLITNDVDEEALMHAKYALFETASDSTGKQWDNVVWITSANLNGASGGNKSNTSIALFGETAGHKELLEKVFRAQWSQTFTPEYLSAIQGIKGTNSGFTFYPSPRKAAKDPAAPPDYEMEFLRSQTNAQLNGTKSDCKAYLVHSLFSESRSGVLDALAALQAESCSVKIVLGENAIGAIVSTYFSMSSKVRDLIDRTEFSNVHDKTLTLSYDLNGTTYGTAWGGSENLNGTSLRYDELSFRADNLALTRAIEQHSERLYKLARGGETNKPVTKITVSPASPATNVGQTLQMRATVTPSDASLPEVTWSSSDTTVATVNAATGRVTAVGTGTAVITAKSVASFTKNGQPVQGRTTLTVSSDGPIAGTDPGAPPLVVSAPPTLTMAGPSGQPYQEPGKLTKIKITWGQGGVDLTGKVTLQYYSGGVWKNYKTYKVSNGVFETDVQLKGTKTFRLRADSVSIPSNTKITSAAKYSSGYRYVIVRNLAATTTPKLYMPTLLRGKGSTLPIVVSWKGSTKRTIVIQYRTGTKWVTLPENEYSMSTNNKIVGAKAPKSAYWRVLAREKGKTTKVTSSTYVKVVG